MFIHFCEETMKTKFVLWYIYILTPLPLLIFIPPWKAWWMQLTTSTPFISIADVHTCMFALSWQANGYSHYY